MKNAPGLGPRQRRRLQAMLGRELGYPICPAIQQGHRI